MKVIRQTTPTEGFINAAEGKLHFLKWDSNGLQSHFSHATGFCAGTYTHLIKYLQKELHVTASDLRGHGLSQFASQGKILNWRIFIEDLKQIIEQTMTPPIIGIGHSLGAVTTYMAAAMYPELFRYVILLDPVMFPPGKIFKRAVLKLIGIRGNVPLIRKTLRRRRVFKNKAEAFKLYSTGRGIFKTWSQEFIEAYIQCGFLEDTTTKEAILACDPKLEAQILKSTPLDVWRYAKDIKCPLLAIRGEFSKTFPMESANRLERFCNDAEVQTILGAGHFFPMEKPRECAQSILEFIKHL